MILRLFVIALLATSVFAGDKSKSQPYWQKMGRNELYKRAEANRIYQPKQTRISSTYNPKAVIVKLPARSPMPKYALKKK